jgi:putative sigma-54 modulation protein
MTFELTGRNVDITPQVEKRIKKAMTKLDRFLDGSASTHIILSAEKHRHRAEIIINWHDHNLTGAAETSELYTSVSQAIDKIHRQALKLKEKFTTRRRLSRRVPKGLLVEEVTTAEPRIIRSPRYAVKPLTPDEAAVHLSHMDEHFLVFRDAESNRIGVIYKRKDGNYGLIEP